MVDENKIKEGVKLLLEGIGEDITREGIVDTPDRIARMYSEIFAGMGQSPEQYLTRTFNAPTSDMVLEKDITFYSTCEHHLMPFYGKAHVAYIPNGNVVGISKLARTVELYAKRPQLQEQLTTQIATALMEHLHAKGAMVMLEAEHMCMTMRGVKKPGTKTVTVCCLGEFENNRELKEQFYHMLGR